MRNIYALLSLSNPELIASYKDRIKDHEIVAAKLIATTHSNCGSVEITNIDNKQYLFNLDLMTRVYQSKGNWIWVKQVNVVFPESLLFSLSINPRVIDMPYSSNQICAHWLFKNFTLELNQFLDCYL